MNKKLIIQLAIIVVAFGAAGVVLYNGFFSGGSQPSGPVGAVASSSVTPEKLLPYGNSPLDFSILDNKRFDFSQIKYPQLDPQNDVGVPESNLIVSSVSE